MRNVIRHNKPPSLCRNATRWRKELLAALSSTKQDRELINRRFNRYKKKDIRIALENMYDGLCCYCEAKIAPVAFGDIEHRRPKKLHPKYTFDWDNLHLACSVCNTCKKVEWDDKDPILDSVQDIISDHLSYEGTGEIRLALTSRGETTIEHACLNRQGLIEARTEIAREIQLLISVLKCDLEASVAKKLRAELKIKASGKYGSLVSWLLDVNFIHGYVHSVA